MTDGMTLREGVTVDELSARALGYDAASRLLYRLASEVYREGMAQADAGRTGEFHAMRAAHFLLGRAAHKCRIECVRLEIRADARPYYGSDAQRHHGRTDMLEGVRS